MDDLLDKVPCGILLFTDEGNIISINSTLADLLGYRTNELEGKNIDSILSVASRIFYNTHFFPILKLHARADEIFITMRTRDKGELPVLTNAVRRQSKSGFENVAVCMPLFQRMKFEEEIIRARQVAEEALRENKALENLTRRLEERTQELERQNQRANSIAQDVLQFGKIVSHDLQEPIRKIRLFVDFLVGTESDSYSKRARSAIDVIQRSAERLVQLTSGLQQYVNVDNDAGRTNVDMNGAFLESLEKVKAERNFHDIVVVKDDLPCVEGYAMQLELMFYHLIDNAVKFRKGDQLTLMITQTLLEENFYQSVPEKYKFVEHVRIEFADNGVGFDEQYRDYIFGLVNKIAPDPKDLGIGLALIKKIVHNHSGSINVRSVPGKGTKVIVILPVQFEYIA